MRIQSYVFVNIWAADLIVCFLWNRLIRHIDLVVRRSWHGSHNKSSVIRDTRGKVRGFRRWSGEHEPTDGRTDGPLSKLELSTQRSPFRRAPACTNLHLHFSHTTPQTSYLNPFRSWTFTHDLGLPSDSGSKKFSSFYFSSCPCEIIYHFEHTRLRFASENLVVTCDIRQLSDKGVFWLMLYYCH